MRLNRFLFDPSKRGLRKVLKEWEALVLRYAWEHEGEFIESWPIWTHVNEVLSGSGRSISRASIIFFLDDMSELGVLSREVVVGKGGTRDKYRALMDERGYRKFIVTTILKSSFRDFPEATRQVVKELA